MKAVTKSVGKEEFPHQHFGFGVFPFDPGHVITPHFLAVHVGHGGKGSSFLLMIFNGAQGL